jgi:hypothetical protein
MSTHATRITAAVIAEAATRLAGVVVQFVEDATIGAALYKPRMEAFLAIDGETELGEDDGTIIVLLTPGRARDLIEEYGTPGRAAAAATAELRKAGAL